MLSVMSKSSDGVSPDSADRRINELNDVNIQKETYHAGTVKGIFTLV